MAYQSATQYAVLNPVPTYQTSEEIIADLREDNAHLQAVIGNLSTGDIAAGFPQEDALSPLINSLFTMHTGVRTILEAIDALIDEAETLAHELTHSADYGRDELRNLESAIEKAQSE